MGRSTAPLALFAAMLAIATALSISAKGQSKSVPGTIADNTSILIDGRNFTLTPGAAKGDISAQTSALGAQSLGPGVIVFRSGDQLYMINAPAGQPRGLSGDAVPPKADERTNRIQTVYEPPKDPQHQRLYEAIKEDRVLETIQQILGPLRLPTDLTIKTMSCNGMINSWYNTDDSVPTVHMCYELLQDILQTAPDKTTPAGITPHDAVAGQFLFWTLHEVGHAVFDLYQIPVFGREEDAADQFAVYIMLQFGKDQARRLVGGAAYAASTFMKNYQQNPVVEKQLEKYSSVHGLPEQRFYNLLCLAYGADPADFADVVDKGYLPKRRAGNCGYEYAMFQRAWRSQISPHVDQQMARKVLDTAWLPPPKPQPEAR